jgi:predicted small metal-binding protein
MMFEVAKHAAAAHGMASLSPATSDAVRAAMVTVAA